jgi:hypothetical protein
MGRAARRKREQHTRSGPRRISLERADYYELSMLGERAMRLEQDARDAAARFAQQIDALRERSNALLVALGTRHAFDPRGTFRLEDKDCALVIEETTQTP